jgi:hypothetical protein
MNNITAYIKHDQIVESHDQIPHAVSDPVKVVAGNAEGAWVVTPLPEGQVVLYDFLHFDEVERIEYEADGFVEVEDGLWVQAFRQEEYTDRVARIETYAVVVDPEELEVVD